MMHALAICLVAWGTIYFLRALPFILFGTAKETPKAVEKFGAIVSPIVIAGLIVYSYAGLEWRTLSPYLAGVVTVILQLWRRNPLVSIIVGTILYMWLVR